MPNFEQNGVAVLREQLQTIAAVRPFNEKLLQAFLVPLLNSVWSPNFQAEVEKVFQQYDDLRYFGILCIQRELQAAISGKMQQNVLVLVPSLLAPPTRKFLVGEQTGVRRAAAMCLLEFLSCITEKSVHRGVLEKMPDLIPAMSDPKVFLTYLVSCIDMGGNIALLALHSVFLLMTQHGCDFPDFYKRVYGLMDRNVLHVKYRTRFFRLFEVFMESTHLPAYLVAAFIKRLARLALFAPPGGALLAIPIIYNMLKTHPHCMVLLRNTAQDPYDFDEADPMQSKALQSSLWELADLERHQVAAVARMAGLFRTRMTRERFNVAEFYGHGYQSVFDSVRVEQCVRAPPLDHEVPKRLFGESSGVISECFE